MVLTVIVASLTFSSAPPAFEGSSTSLKAMIQMLV